MAARSGVRRGRVTLVERGRDGDCSTCGSRREPGSRPVATIPAAAHSSVRAEGEMEKNMWDGAHMSYDEMEGAASERWALAEWQGSVRVCVSFSFLFIFYITYILLKS